MAMKPGPTDSRLNSGNNPASKIFAARAVGINRVGAEALVALHNKAADTESQEVGLNTCGGCTVLGFIRKPLAATSSGSELLRWFNADGEGRIGRDEWELAVELLGITAAEDETGQDVRRMQLDYLAANAFTRLTSINALDVEAKGMLGRDVMFEGAPLFNGWAEPMRVTKVPEDSRIRGWMSGNKPKGFDLKGRFSGEVLNNVSLRYKSNASGVDWAPAPPTEASVLGQVQLRGGARALRNPLLDAVHSEPMLVEEAAQKLAGLDGDELSRGRSCGYCLAESTYRGCGPIPMFVVPFGFFIHGAMVCAPCTVCCIIPCQMSAVGRAHSLVLRPSTLHVRTEAHEIPVRPFAMCSGLGGSYSIARCEDVFPLVELRDVEVVPPQPYGLNGWCHTLVVRDVSGVVICAIDHRSKPALEAFARTLRDALGASTRRPLSPALLEAYREHAALSWVGLERARHGISHGAGAGTTLPAVGTALPMGGAVPTAVPISIGIGGAVGPLPMGLAVGGGGGVEMGAHAPSPLSMDARGVPPPPAYPAASLYPEGGGYAGALRTALVGGDEEKMDAPLVGKDASDNTSHASAGYASTHGPAPSLASSPVPPRHEMIGVRVPQEALATGIMQFDTPAGQTMQVNIPAGLGAGDTFHVVVPSAAPGAVPPMAVAVARPEPPGGWKPLTSW